MFPKRTRQRAIERAVAWVDRAAQRRGRARRDFSGHGQQRDDVRRAGLSGGPSAARDRAQVDREAAGRARATRPIASPACRRSGTPGWSATRCWKSAARARRRGQARPRLARAEADARRAGDWVVRRPDLRPGGWAFQYANSALSRRRRHRGGGHGDGSRAEPVAAASDYRAAIARARRMDRRHAERERRLGRVRRRQRVSTISTTFRSPITARCSIRRPRMSPRAACRCWRSSARPRRTAPAVDARRRLSAAHAACRRQLVRPLGHELHLRHLVGAVRAQRRRRRSRRAGDAQGARTGWSPIQNADGGWGEDGSSYKLDYHGYEPAP